MKPETSLIRAEQKKVTALVTKKFKQYYLTGGTALAFYFNHRISKDLDFFSQTYDRSDPDRIMDFISERTRQPYRFEQEQDDPKLVPMKVYTLEIRKGVPLKVDFVQDFVKNRRPVKKGLHSVDDIYYRKIWAGIGGRGKVGSIGQGLPSGRQSAKDAYDLYWLSRKHKALSDFFIRNFSEAQAERLILWWKGFNRRDLKLELMDLTSGADPRKVLQYLDDEILKKFPGKLF
jgi:hypothetical protein